MVTKQRHLTFYNLFQRNGWNGLLNVHNSPVCLSDFVKQDNTWNSQIDSIQNIEDFNRFVQDKSVQFAKWAVSQTFNRESEKTNDNWFKGILGEYFYIENIEDMMKQIWSNDGLNYAFEHAVPASFYRLTSHTRIEFGGDYGTDAIGINRNDEVCVAQIKCWNIFSDKLITYGDVVSNLYNDATEREWIYHKQKESMFVLWLGKIKNISKPLLDPECPNYGKVHYFGYEDLKLIHTGYPRFFNNNNQFKVSLKNIASYKNYCENNILQEIDTL